MKPFAFVLVCAVLAAGTASAQDVRIDTRDLDLTRHSDLAVLDQRVETQARQTCRAARRIGSRIPDTAYCRDAFRADVERQLPSSSRYEFARSRTGRVTF
jgi:UrcA family protein